MQTPEHQRPSLLTFEDVSVMNIDERMRQLYEEGHYRPTIVSVLTYPNNQVLGVVNKDNEAPRLLQGGIERADFLVPRPLPWHLQRMATRHAPVVIGAALRESWEEVGLTPIDIQGIRVLGGIIKIVQAINDGNDRRKAYTGVQVFLGKEARLMPSLDEVNMTLRVPAETLLRAQEALVPSGIASEALVARTRIMLQQAGLLAG